jgi:hypothetical protein
MTRSRKIGASCGDGEAQCEQDESEGFHRGSSRREFLGRRGVDRPLETFSTTPSTADESMR